jgi:activator of HSP90 ATPase
MLIHQESIINAGPQAVYEVLTDGQKFAAATGMPAHLSEREGETFTLFGGRVEGRYVTVR